MKIDELLEKRKNQLDLDEVPVETWSGISKRWNRPGKNSLNIWKVAASLLLLMVIGLILHNRQLERKVEKLATLGDISEEYLHLEASYQEQIDQLEAAIPIQSVQQKKEFDWIFEELEVLDQVNKIYRADIGRASSDQLIPTLLDYYEKKIKLLKRLQLEIERKNNYEESKTNTISGAAV